MRRVWAILTVVSLLVVGAASPALAAEPGKGTVEGTALLRDADGVRHVSMVAYPYQWSEYDQEWRSLGSYQWVGSGGRFSWDLSPGEYKFLFVASQSEAPEMFWTPDGPAVDDLDRAGVIRVTADQTTRGIRMELPAWGSIGAHVAGPWSTGSHSAFAWLEGIDADGVPVDRFAHSATVGWDGRLWFPRLLPGSYLLRAAPDSTTGLTGEYWSDARYRNDATLIEIGPGQKRELGEIEFDPPSYDITRLSGADRYETAAAISRATFEDGPAAERLAYVANGRNFPDALIAGPVAAPDGAALLLTEAESLPASTREELLRLRPGKIIVLGQEPSVSEAVRREIEQLTGVAVERIGGSNRFETAETLIRGAFEEKGADRAFVVTGGNFPDALAAGPVAAAYNAPVVMVPPSGVTARETGLIRDLGVSEVVVLGDEAAVSDASYRSLANIAGVTRIDRIGGRDRYETAAELNGRLMGRSDVMAVATGENFPDALVGGVLTARIGTSLMLTRRDCVPPEAADDIERRGPAGLIIFGSEASVGPRVETLSRCS